MPHKILIADPYIELHTGPGRGYPVFHVVERGREVEIVKRRTDWFQIRTERGIEGWVPREQMIATLSRPASRSTCRSRRARTI